MAIIEGNFVKETVSTIHVVRIRIGILNSILLVKGLYCNVFK